ncbi:DUF2589 domain-containing protein [Emcibacter sp.]|uniref:DUF2589 domain-containing protein n=1 Tax=Emcibacter sp. TaxID=1979954 RepID=UPI003A91C21E
MISLDNLIQAVQKSAEAAAKSIMDRNLALLGHFFEEVPVEEEDDDGGRNGRGGRGGRNGRGGGKKGSDDDGDDDGYSHYLHPRMVAMKFAKMTPDGPQDHLVHVPLISIAPFSSLQLDTMEFQIEMDIHEEEGEVQVSFPMKKKGFFPSKDSSAPSGSRAQVKITMKGFDRPKGLDVIIEGFDKSLRAQIPG